MYLHFVSQNNHEIVVVVTVLTGNSHRGGQMPVSTVCDSQKGRVVVKEVVEHPLS
jgi:hypothetical protein